MLSMENNSNSSYSDISPSRQFKSKLIENVTDRYATNMETDTCSMYDYQLSSPETATTVPTSIYTPTYTQLTNAHSVDSPTTYLSVPNNGAGNVPTAATGHLSTHPIFLHHHSFPQLPDYLSYAFSMWRMQTDTTTVHNTPTLQISNISTAQYV